VIFLSFAVCCLFCSLPIVRLDDWVGVGFCFSVYLCVCVFAVLLLVVRQFLLFHCLSFVARSTCSLLCWFLLLFWLRHFCLLFLRCCLLCRLLFILFRLFVVCCFLFPVYCSLFVVVARRLVLVFFESLSFVVYYFARCAGLLYCLCRAVLFVVVFVRCFSFAGCRSFVPSAGLLCTARRSLVS
jgi:hypothetical protein